MKCRKMALITMVGILLVLFGCSANSVSLTDRSLVSVEKRDSEKVKILWTDVYQKKDMIWAYGVLKQRSSRPGAIKTHVDIQVLDFDGSIQYETISEDMYVPRNNAGKGINWRRFKVLLPEKLQEDSRIIMTVHSGSHKQIDDRS